MPRQLQNITIGAPAFKGLNTEDSPLHDDVQFAAVADNCIIDQYGRLGARNGYTVLTTDATALGSDFTTVIHEYEKHNGTKIIVSAGNNKIFTGDTTLTDITGGAVITDDNWKIVSFNDKCYFFNINNAPLVYDGTTLSANATAPQGNCCLAAFGRLFVANITGNKHTVYWSDLLDGTNWTTGTSGSIDISKVWPDGYDEIVALASHNNFLIIFGTRSIIVYEGAGDPATMTLADTVVGVGCVARDSVQNIGSDVLFLSHAGVVSFGRVIQERSLPISKISQTVNNDIIYAYRGETQNIVSMYSPRFSFYLLLFKDSNLVFCFDTRGRLENGAFRVTRWTSLDFKCFARLDSGDIYVGTTDGVGKYTGYTDNGLSYQFRWYSHPLSFGDASRLKMLKKIRPVVIGGPSTIVFAKWAYDFSGAYHSGIINVSQGTPAYYNESEYNIAEYTAGINFINKAINAGGHGSLVSIGVETEINGQPFSLQKLDLQAIVGKMI